MAEQRSYTGSFNNRWKFTGKELDEGTGLYYFGARFYNPVTSLWLSVDPLVEKTMDAYGYCYQNPIMLTDPTGMSPEGGEGGDPPNKNWAGRTWETIKSWFSSDKPKKAVGTVVVGALEIGNVIEDAALDALSYIWDKAANNPEHAGLGFPTEAPTDADFDKQSTWGPFKMHDANGDGFTTRAEVAQGQVFAANIIMAPAGLTASTFPKSIQLAVKSAGPDVALASAYISRYKNLANGYTDFVMHGSELNKLTFFEFNKLLTSKGIEGNIRLWICNGGANQRAIQLLANRRGVNVLSSPGTIRVGEGYFKFEKGTTFNLTAPK